MVEEFVARPHQDTASYPGIGSRLSVIVFADAVGSSLSMSADEVAAMSEIDKGVELFASKAGEFGGAMLNFTGDGAVATFGSSVSAVKFGLAFQDLVARLSPDIKFRIGIHLGEIIDHHGRSYGQSINMAERLQSVAPPGGIIVSEAVYKTIKGRHEFSFEHVGLQTLKSFPEPIDVFRVYDCDVAATLKPSGRPLVNAVAIERLTIPAIAVLPLRDLSETSDHGVFADGVADDIITNLCRFRGIDVISRGSSFIFNHTPLASTEIGKRLGARYLVEGSIRWQSSRIRVTVELSDVITGRIIWAERYDRPNEDIFEIQDDIASMAVGAISATIERTEQQRVAITPPDSLEAYGLVLRGTSYVLGYSPECNQQALSLFERALELSPSYGRAYAALSRSHSLDWRYSWSTDRERSLENALKLAVQATETGEGTIRADTPNSDMSNSIARSTTARSRVIKEPSR